MNDTGMKAQTQELGHTPNSKYLQTEVLHTLQDFVSDSAAEPAFLANVQISEIYWALMIRKLISAQAGRRRDRVPAMSRILRRIVSYMEVSNANWRSLSWLTPTELMPVLKGLGQINGNGPALQQ